MIIIKQAVLFLLSADSYRHPVICMIIIHQSVRKLQLFEYLNIRHDTDLGKTPPVFDLFDEVSNIHCFYFKHMAERIIMSLTTDSNATPFSTTKNIQILCSRVGKEDYGGGNDGIR